MEWAFDNFVLSQERAELSGPNGPVHIETQPLKLLCLLAGNADRVVSKDEICDRIWDGRIISDATISTAVKQARKAVGDDGTQQRVIRTVHGRGFRFVADLLTPAQPLPPQPDAPIAPDRVGTAKPSVAVLRFDYLGSGLPGPAIADAVPAELIASLSRLKWVRVIARGSSFRFDPQNIEPEVIGAQLGVRYLITGTVESLGEMLTFSIELIAADSGEIVWSDRFASTLHDIHIMRANVVSAVISAMELELPKFEADAARRLSPEQLDAWSHFHLGLRHIYRFNETDNHEAALHFQQAISKDPEFARAHAGLSFSHWQTAFMQYGEGRQSALALAVEAADRALSIDFDDPFANYNMGRAKWLEGDAAAGLPWFDKALKVNPNFAQCHYANGLNEMLVGNTEQARQSAKQARLLSPLDPLRYGMIAVTAMSHISSGEFSEAARHSDLAAQSPGSHFYINMISAFCHELNGDRLAATRRLDQAREGRSELSKALFFEAFPFSDLAVRSEISRALDQLGVE